MAANALACAACTLPVPAEFWNREEGVRCAGCGNIVRAAVFPALERAPMGSSSAALQGETEASCFYHPQSRAAQVCETCGRFLCNLCDLDVDGRHLCPRCFETVGFQAVETRRTMYDSMALAVSIFPALLLWPAIVGAPWALFLVIRRWNTPGSVVPRTKVRFILAALFAIAEIVGMAFIVYLLTQVTLKGIRGASRS